MVVTSGELAGFQYVREMVFDYELDSLAQYYQALAIYAKYEREVVGFTVYSRANLRDRKILATFKLLFFANPNLEQDVEDQFATYYQSL